MTIVVAIITIAVLTFFMLLEGSQWFDRGLGLLSPDIAAALEAGRATRSTGRSAATSPARS